MNGHEYLKKKYGEQVYNLAWKELENNKKLDLTEQKLKELCDKYFNNQKNNKNN